MAGSLNTGIKLLASRTLPRAINVILKFRSSSSTKGIVLALKVFKRSDALMCRGFECARRLTNRGCCQLLSWHDRCSLLEYLLGSLWAWSSSLQRACLTVCLRGRLGVNCHSNFLVEKIWFDKYRLFLAQSFSREWPRLFKRNSNLRCPKWRQPQLLRY